MKAIQMIEAQQKGREGTAVYMVGQQLKDLCAQNPDWDDLVAADLEGGSLSLEGIAGKLKARADELHKKHPGNCICIPPDAAEQIIREYFGLPDGAAKEPGAEPREMPRLEDFF